MSGHLSYPRERAFKTNGVRKGQKKGNIASLPCVRTAERALQLPVCQKMPNSSNPEGLQRTFTTSKNEPVLLRTQTGKAANQSARPVAQRETAPLPELPHHDAQQYHVTELCLLYTRTLKPRETFVQKPNLVWPCWQSSEETAIPHRDFLLPHRNKEGGKKKNADSESRFPMLLLLCVTAAAFREVPLQAQTGKLTPSRLWRN